MSTNFETKIDELGNTFSQFMKTNDERENATKARAAELNEQLKKMNDRMDTLETKASRPAPVVEADEALRAFNSEAKAFGKFMRKGAERLSPEEIKSLSTDSNQDGGYLVAPNVNQTIIELLVQISPLRSLAAIETITQGNVFEEPYEASTLFAVSSKGERATPATTTSGQIDLLKIPVHTQYAKPLATQQMLDDTNYPLEGYIARKVGQQFAKAEGTWFITGTGSGQPLGIIDTTNKANSTATATSFAANADGFDCDDVLSLMAAQPEYYAKGSSFLMKRSTKFIMRKLKNGQGTYLWEPSFQKGVPASFDGCEVHEAIDMAVPASGAYPIAFGDWKSAYKIVDRAGIVLLRDPFSSKPYVEFYTTRRVGGQTVLPEAIQLMKCTA